MTARWFSAWTLPPILALKAVRVASHFTWTLPSTWIPRSVQAAPGGTVASPPAEMLPRLHVQLRLSAYAGEATLSTEREAMAAASTKRFRGMPFEGVSRAAGTPPRLSSADGGGVSRP